jgi:hypothetical protein
MTTTTWQSTPAGKAFLLRHGRKKKIRITWLARARILSGQSVAQAAKACGLNPRTWAAWEVVGAGGKEPAGPAVVRLMMHFQGLLHIPLSGKRTMPVNPATLEVLGE